MRGLLNEPQPSLAVLAKQLEELYRRYGPRVYRNVHARLRDPHEALDVMQDTFLAYMLCHPGLRGEALPSTVLCAIARHKAVDCLRRHIRWSEPMQSAQAADEEDTSDPQEAAITYEGGIGCVEASHDLVALLRDAPPDVLGLIRLHLMEGYSLSEAGQKLNLSRKIASKQLRAFSARARRAASTPL